MLGLTKSNTSFTPAEVHSETVYCDLVRNEAKRSERSGHLCRVLLIYRADMQGQVVPFGSELVDKTISVLSRSCRDTDYIGWYRQGRILGVLMTAFRPNSARDGDDNLRTRLADSLHGVLPFTHDCSLQIRVLEQSELTAFNVSDHPAPSPGS